MISRPLWLGRIESCSEKRPSSGSRGVRSVGKTTLAAELDDADWEEEVFGSRDSVLEVVGLATRMRDGNNECL
jgi:hypothetical protein